MRIIYRRGIPVEKCTTLRQASLSFGGSDALLKWHKRHDTPGFPKMVAQFGSLYLYVEAELEAFYNSVLWRKQDAYISELIGDGSDG